MFCLCSKLERQCNGRPAAYGLCGVKRRGCSRWGADQRSLHLFGSRSEMSSVSHYASGSAGLSSARSLWKTESVREMREPGRREMHREGARREEWAGWHETTEREIAERRRLDSWNEKGNRFRGWCDVFHSACGACAGVLLRPPRIPRAPGRIYEWIQVRNRCDHMSKHIATNVVITHFRDRGQWYLYTCL